MTNQAQTKTVFEALEGADIESINTVTDEAVMVTWLLRKGGQETILYEGEDAVRSARKHLAEQSDD